MNNRQIALAGSVGSSSINPKVPMFLQKLYKIVDDPSTNDVICWSDTGDSFFVLDHELLAKEHLGNWFKHNKFQSFVRQLNMYGFHKIPHLQQGVLRSESNTEHWQFAHEHFHRGQESRLIFIERKKQQQAHQKDLQQQAAQQSQSQQQQGQLPAPGQQPQLPYNLSSSPVPLSQSPTGPSLDIHNVLTGIAAIRRHQTTITSELEELKRSNQALWRESIEARNRHTKQQDTINRIVKFLAGVFGQHGPPGSKDGDLDGTRRPSPGLPVARLMIEDKLRDHTSHGKVSVTEVRDDEGGSPQSAVLPTYQSVETPSSTSPPSPPAMSEAPSLPSPNLEYPPTPPLAASQPSFPPEANSEKQNSIISTQPRYPITNSTDDAQVQDRRSPSLSPGLEAKIQATLSQIPATELQQIFQSLAAQPPYSSSDPWGTSNMMDTGEDGGRGVAGQVMPYQGPPANGYDWTQFYNQHQNFIDESEGGANANLPGPETGGVPGEGLMSFDPPGGSPGAIYSHDHGARLEHSWRQAEDIDREVSSVNSGITSLIETLGLDPAMLEASGGVLPDPQMVAGRKMGMQMPEVVTPGGGIDGPPGGAHDGPSPGGGQELFDAFLNNLNAPTPTNAHTNFDDSTNSSFLDQVPSPMTLRSESKPPSRSSGGSASPVIHQRPAPAEPPPPLASAKSAGGRKRKSDVVMATEPIPESPSTTSSAAANTRSKRRKDR